MRKGSTQIAKAFLIGRPATLKNDTTTGSTLYYHGNAIAKRNEDGTIDCTLAGWNTVTTRLRLNQLSDLLGSSWRVRQRKYKPMFYNWRNQCEMPIGERDWFTLVRD